MSDKKLNFAVIGCGRIAERKAPPDFTRSGTGEAHCCSRCIDESKAKPLGEKYDIPAYQSYHDMLKQHPEIDVVCILTESGNHADCAIDVAGYNKHVVVEKPMALTLDDADRMIRACDENGVKLMIVKQNRYNLPVTKLREALELGRFGKLVMGTVRVRWCRTQEYYDQAAIGAAPGPGMAVC